MKRTILLLTALLWLAPAAAQSRIELFTVQSRLLGCAKSCSVYLPDGYDASGEAYPVLYLLHGASGDHTDWPVKGNLRQIADEAVAAGTARRMIVVMPDASGPGGEAANFTGYFDMPGWCYERFFFEELLPAVERHYRIRGDKRHRAIGGLSMGGGGAATYALRHPESFGSACPLSACLAELPATLRDGLSAEYLQSVADNGAVKLLGELADDRIAPLRTVRWRIECGDDDFLWEGNIGLYELMRRRGIPLEFRMRDGGHTWRYWQTALPAVLTFVSTGFAE